MVVNHHRKPWNIPGFFYIRNLLSLSRPDTYPNICAICVVLVKYEFATEFLGFSIPETTPEQGHLIGIIEHK